ncbi:MAG: DUF1573 domain-containing protein [Deltaproteobacteria bacterium]|nr:DUF1573 domain-containing protein [Deltaproteobacteria bacterium]
MKTRITLVLSLFLSLTIVDCCLADGPRIVFQRLSHDYGKVFSGQTVLAEFDFQNDGDSTLKIEGLTASCGCTKAVEGNKEIPAHGVGKITAEFDTIGLKAGRKEKSIYVKTNDPVTPVVKLTLLADVVKDLSVSPPSLNKKVSSIVEPVVFPIDITDMTSERYRIVDASTVEGEAEVSLDPANLTLEPKSTSHLNLFLKLKPEANRSFYAGRIRLKTDHPHESEIEVPFLVKVDNAR